MVGYSQYPNAIDTDEQLAHLIDRSSDVLAKDLTSIRDAIFSIERTMGVVPQGSFLTLKERLDNIDESFLPLTGGSMVGNLNLRTDISNVSSRVLLGTKNVGLAFDEFSKVRLAAVDLGTPWMPSDVELAANADSLGTVPFSIIGKNTGLFPDASGSMVSSGRRKVKFYDDVHVAGNIYIKDFISTPRVVVEKTVNTGSISQPEGPHSGTVKTLVSGGIDILGSFKGNYGMSYLGGIMLKRWWTDPDWSTQKVSEIPLIIPTDQFGQDSWQNILIIYSAEFHETNLVLQLYVNGKTVSGPILYSKLSNNRSIMNFVVLNRANLDGQLGWTNSSDQSQSYLEQLNGTISSNVSNINTGGTNTLNSPLKNENKFWNGSLGFGNCYGNDLLEYVDTSNFGNQVIRIGMKLAKHDFHNGSIFQHTASYVEDEETNISDNGTRATCPDVRNIQIIAISLNDADIASGDFNLNDPGMINRVDLTSAFNTVTNPAINPDAVGAHS